MGNTRGEHNSMKTKTPNQIEVGLTIWFDSKLI